jgi:hypothetical protein
MGALKIRDYNAAMQRVASITLLAAALLLAASAQAQRGGAMRGGGGRTVLSHGAGGHNRSRSGSAENSRTRSFRSNHFGNDNLGNNSLLYPVWYDEPYDGEEVGPPEESGPPLMPAPMMAQGGNPRPAARRIPTGPKITELPGRAQAVASARLPPAMFILTNGERIEARQYLVTYDQVQLVVDRQPRTIPLSMLDMNATLAANRQRGIDMRIPSGQHEISLGF